MKFDELNIDERILRAVEDMGFEETSPIQTQAIPAVLEGIDVIGQAQTGTGKTAAYSIPMLQKINPDVKKPQAIVLCPTRELAVQVAEEIRKLAKYMSDIKVLPVYGGQEIVRQIKSLKAGVQIIVGTPGRVMDHMRRKTVKFDSVSMVILDEADEMLDMGFREDMETILTETPEERQTVLFSATMPKPIMEIARKFQKDAKIIKVVRKELTVSNIDQFYYEVRPKNKTEILSRLIDIYNPKLSVVFCNTKRQVDELISELKGRGYFADGIHGDMKQQQRDRVMDDFRSGKTEILIATDVAARGIDVDGVDIVFNYDLPQDEEYYVHRIGRTGRAGKSGLALSFISGREVYKLKDIERYCKTKILAKPIPSLDDVKNTKMDGIFDKIKEMIEADEHRAMLDMVEEHVNQEDYTSMDMAAALLKMIVGDTLDRIDEVENFHFDENADTSRMVRLFINVGKKDNITPANILGAIAGESGMPGRLVGAIDMMDNYTFVDVPAKHAEAVLAAMNDNVLIKGRKVNVEKANVSAKPARKSKSKPPGSIGETSTLAILIGGAILLITGIASWRVMLSVFAGGIFMSYICNWFANPDIYPAAQLSPACQICLGGFAFAAVFMATDPVTGSRTNTGKYIFGFLVGVLAILIRVFNTGYPEGAMLAVLLMNAFAPLIDYFVVEANIRHRLKRAKNLTK